MSKSSVTKALKFILNSDLLDLTIDTSAAHYGLRFYTEFNRIDAVDEMPKLVVNNNLVSCTANIITPVDYPSRFDNLMNHTKNNSRNTKYWHCNSIKTTQIRSIHGSII